MIKKLQEPPKYWLDLDLCKKLYRKFGETLSFDEPIPPFKTRFEGKLEGILGSVEQSYAGTLANPTIIKATASYFYQLIIGHPFKNGNKRMAVLFVHAFLLKHGFDFNIQYRDLGKVAVKVVELSENVKRGDLKNALELIFARIVIEKSN